LIIVTIIIIIASGASHASDATTTIKMQLGYQSVVFVFESVLLNMSVIAIGNMNVVVVVTALHGNLMI
jgi:hypothetical protein